MGAEQGKKNQKEQVREVKRELKTEGKELDRETARLDREIHRVESEIKRDAKRGDMPNAKRLAKELISLRKTRDQLSQMKSHIGSVSTTVTAIGAQSTMINSFEKATKALTVANKTTSSAAVTMRNYAIASEKMNLSQDMMDDLLCDAFDGDEEDEQADILTKQVLDEIGIGIGRQLAEAPTTRISNKKSAAVADEDSTEAILRQLNLA